MIGEEIELLAEAMAAHLDRLSNWNKYSDLAPRRGFTEEKIYRRIQERKAELATCVAAATGRDLNTVSAEAELGFMMQLARILAATIDPNTASLVDSTVSEAGEVCAVCQDEMQIGSVSRGLGCSHTFHRRCIESGSSHITLARSVGIAWRSRTSVSRLCIATSD